MCQSIFRFKRRKNISTGETAALGWWESPVPETGIELHNYLSDWWEGGINSKSGTLNAEVRVHSFTTRVSPNRKIRAEHLTSASPFSLHPSIHLSPCPCILRPSSFHPSVLHHLSSIHLSIHLPIHLPFSINPSILNPPIIYPSILHPSPIHPSPTSPSAHLFKGLNTCKACKTLKRII